MSAYIHNKAADLLRRYQTRDPLELAAAIGIHLRFADLGSLKGLYTVIKRNRYIVLHENLGGAMQKIVCAHELGHDQLHRSLAEHQMLQEFMLYRMDSQPEYEANLFAADLLLPDDEVLEYVYHYHFTAPQIAAAMHSDINLVALKMLHLAQQGYDVRGMDYRSDFLKESNEFIEY